MGQICDLARLFALFRTLPLQPDTQNANMKLLTVLSKRRIVEFTKRHADAEIELKRGLLSPAEPNGRTSPVSVRISPMWIR